MVLVKYLKAGSGNEKLSLLNKSILQLYNIGKVQNSIKSLENQYLNSNKTYETFKKEKIKHIRKILESITDRINKYYNYIHGDDYINSPKFMVSGSTGLKLKINSFNDETDPREFSSEGHLDSLGLCIFLAFLKENSNIPIIILDDIISTVDLSHKFKIGRLLTEEFEDYQLIITTHNKLWFKQIKNLIDTRNRINRNKDKSKECVSIEITNWNIEEGPYLSNNKTDIQTVQKHLINNDLIAAVHGSRRYLEQVLRNIVKVNRARVPYKEEPYSLLELLNAAEKEVEFKTENSFLKDFFLEPFIEIEYLRKMGNDFVHESFESEFLTFNEAKSFCDAVFNLQETFVCKECGSYLVLDKWNNKVYCSNKKCNERFDF